MTTTVLEELEGGLDSCLASKDLSALLESCPGWLQENKAQVTSRLSDCSSWPHVRPSVAGGSQQCGCQAPKMEKESAARGGPGPGKEKLKVGTTPQSAPSRKKAQAAPPLQPLLPPPTLALSEELPWGDLSLNKCLVLASLVALLGSTFQLCRDAASGEVAHAAPTPKPRVPPSSQPKKPVLILPNKPVAWAPPSEPPARQAGSPTFQAEVEVRPEVPKCRESVKNIQEEPGETRGKTAREEQAPIEKGGPQQRLWKEKKPRREKPRMEDRPRKERSRKEERSRASREAREALTRRWEAREEGHRPRARDSRDPEHFKRQAWASSRRRDYEDQTPGRQKHREGKGRD
ncbi:junctional sarcoplasmic reticulum protein 1 [Castor canadensis]|uniref:Junctional sarcoplasmic reticulum protein 1 n=1 Tax=Castor canadensis TaxID=51338 RepID=A0A8B7UY38_CASCN